MWRKFLGYLLIIGSAAIVAIAIALAFEPDARLWQSIGPLLLATLFFVQGRSYLSKGKPAMATDQTEARLEEKKIGNTLERLKAATPRFLANFKVKDSFDFTRGRYSQPDFVVKQVACACGSEDVELLASRTNDGECLAPIYLRCSECSSRQLLFDPAIHGWDGEGGNSASRVGEGEPTAVASSPGVVIVVYSYQGIENYEDLIEGGAANPENFFDTLQCILSSKAARVHKLSLMNAHEGLTNGCQTTVEQLRSFATLEQRCSGEQGARLIRNA